MVKIFNLVLLAAVMLAGSTLNAGTVTLTGSCRNNLMPGNVINFTISNSGNDSASNLILIPRVAYAEPTNPVISSAQLKPGSSITYLVPLSNVGVRGSTVASFMLSYEQGASSYFSTVFPCMINIGNYTVSEIYQNVNVTRSGNEYMVNATLFNAGPESLDVIVSLLASPAFTYLSAPYLTERVPAYSKRNASFELSAGASADYSGAVAMQYVLNGTSYASLSLISLEASQPAGNRIIANAPLIGIAMLLVAILVLMSYGVLKRRKKGGSESQQGNKNGTLPQDRIT